MIVVEVVLSPVFLSGTILDIVPVFIITHHVAVTLPDNVILPEPFGGIDAKLAGV